MDLIADIGFKGDRAKARDTLGWEPKVPLRDGAERHLTLYLIFADRDYAGPGLLRLAEVLRTTAAENCAARQAAIDAASRHTAAAAKTQTKTSRRRAT